MKTYRPSPIKVNFSSITIEIVNELGSTVFLLPHDHDTCPSEEGQHESPPARAGILRSRRWELIGTQ
jgi:hypothetical protein